MNQQELIDLLPKIEKKLTLVVERNQRIIPYTTDERGHYLDMTQQDPFWWTNGFWGGLLWQLYHLTKNDLFRRTAVQTEQTLAKNLVRAENLDHDNGFKWSLTAVARYRITGAQDAKNDGIIAAENLAGRFNLAGRYLRAWNDGGTGERSGGAIIDCLMNLPLLYWASAELNDPRFYQIAYAHAKTAQAHMVRPDGSVKHIIEFDPQTGEYLRSQGGQGYGHGSSWTRGQAWGIYGFALSYQYTQDRSFLATAQQIANYFIANIPATGLIPVDFRQPQAPWLEDSSAAAIAASGLITLAEDVDAADREIYLNAARRLLSTLAESSCDWRLETDNLLTKCTAAYHDEKREFPIIYGDYFFLEALEKLAGRDLNLW